MEKPTHSLYCNTPGVRVQTLDTKQLTSQNAIFLFISDGYHLDYRVIEVYSYAEGSNNIGV